MHGASPCPPLIDLDLTLIDPNLGGDNWAERGEPFRVQNRPENPPEEKETGGGNQLGVGV